MRPLADVTLIDVMVLMLLLASMLVVALPRRWIVGRWRGRSDLVGAARETGVLRKALVLMGVQVGLVAAVLGSWVLQGRGIEGLGLGVPSGWRGWIGVVVAVLWWGVVAWGAMEDVRGARACEACRAESLARHGRPGRSRWLMLVVLVGAIEEEVICRGFMLVVGWGLAAGMLVAGGVGVGTAEMIGAVVALLATSVVFGAAHGSGGRSSVLFAAGAGVILATLTLVSGSLWPAIVMHVGQNAVAGWAAVTIGRMPEPTPGARHVEEKQGN